MISPPPEVRKGDRITAAWANQLREAVLARTPLSTADIGIKESPAGYKPWVKQKGGGGGGGAQATAHPWQPYLAPYGGTGEPPASQTRTIRIRPGSVTLGATMIPANKNIEIEIPEDSDEGYFVWLQVDILTGTAGHYISATAYGHGVELPDAVDADPEAGTPPPTIYIPLFYVTTIGDEIDEVVQLRDNSLSLSITLVDVGCDSKLLSISIS